MRNALAGLGLIVALGMGGVALADTPAVPAGTVAAPATTDSGAAAAATAGAPQQPSMLGMVAPFALMFGVFYFFMIRPQQKKMKEHQDLVSSLKTGDEVVTSAGILGKIAGVAEKTVTVEVADSVKIKILKGQISQIVKGQIKETV